MRLGRAKNNCPFIVINRNHRLLKGCDVDVPTGVLGLEGVTSGLVESRLFYALLHEPNNDTNNDNQKNYAHAPLPVGAALT